MVFQPDETRRTNVELMGIAEETLDLILLIVRNGVQFLRLFNILRRYVRLSPIFNSHCAVELLWNELMKTPLPSSPLTRLSPQCFPPSDT